MKFVPVFPVSRLQAQILHRLLNVLGNRAIAWLQLGNSGVAHLMTDSRSSNYTTFYSPHNICHCQNTLSMTHTPYNMDIIVFGRTDNLHH